MDNLALKIKQAHEGKGSANYTCVAIFFTQGDWFCAANGITLNREIVQQKVEGYCKKLWMSPPNSSPNSPPDLSSQIVIVDTSFFVGTEGASTHAEMAIVREICTLDPSRCLRGGFSSLYMGVSKEVCRKCATILDFLGIEHRATHQRATDLDGWEFPNKFFSEEFPSLNDNRRADSEDEDPSYPGF